MSSLFLYDPNQVENNSLDIYDAAFPLIDFEMQEKEMHFEKNPLPRVSVGVVVRSNNDIDVIGQMLKAMDSQEIKPNEVIVADCQSTDGTREAISKYRHPILDIQAKEYFPGKVLNRAIEKLSSEIILFINSDTVCLTPKAFTELLRPFSDPDIHATYARQFPRPDALPWVIRDYEAAFPEGKAPDWMHLSLPLAAIRRKTWEKHPFYTHAWGSEDMEWGLWAKSQGYKVVYVPSSKVMHSHNYTFRQLYGRKFIEGEADAVIKKENYSISKMLADVIRSTARDYTYHFQRSQFQALSSSFFRRFVYYWGYYKGHSLGRARTISDSHIGQKVILERYKK